MNQNDVFSDFFQKDTQKEKTKLLLDGSDDSKAILDAAIEDFGEKQSRSNAMAVVLSFAEGDSHTFDDIDAIAQAMADIAITEEDGEDDDDIVTTTEEQQAYDFIMSDVFKALQFLGVKSDCVGRFLNDEDDKEGEKCASFINAKLDVSNDSDAEIIAKFAVGEKMILDAMKKVVRDGEIKWIRDKPLKKRTLTRAMKEALKKARKFAHTAAAKIKRQKSMMKRKQAGL